MEKVLAFQIEDTAAIRKILDPLRIRLIECKPEEFKQTIGKLAKVADGPQAEPFTGKAPKESMLVFCELTDKHLDKVLLQLRQKGIAIDFKAVMTPSNRNWSVLELYLELERERNQIRLGK